MLTSLSFRGFQKHQRIDIELGRITCFVGGTDRGKSSTLRGLEWVCLNRPSGDAFISFGHAFAKASLIADDHVIVRKKGKGINSYNLDGGKYVSFHSAVPDAIANILNVDQRNFSGQHDPPFWLSLPPGQVSKELNEIIDLSVIDSTLANIAKRMRVAKAAQEVAESRLAEARAERKRLAWTVAANERIAQLAAKEVQIAEKSHRIDSLAAILEEAKRCSGVLESPLYANLDRLRASLAGLDAIAGRIHQKQQQMAALEATIGEAKKVAALADRLAADAETAKAELAERMEGACPVCGKEI